MRTRLLAMLAPYRSSRARLLSVLIRRCPDCMLRRLARLAFQERDSQIRFSSLLQK